MITYNENIEFTGKQILLFSTEWCPDCIMLKMYIDQVVSDNPEWEFIFIDSDLHPSITADYGILGIPSFVALNNGEEVSNLISKQAKPKELINDWIAGIDA
ncbi:thioredoxin family protein [Mollicutes bacterium LVI A0039]|nr:thioredoxin family protein [Mollicutes bacterium LVI A0039]